LLYETFPPMIAIPLGPEGGAGLLGGVADAARIADLKGSHTVAPEKRPFAAA
jgi:hypothetical protein